MTKRKRGKQREPSQPVELDRYVEWQEKQYLPGYYTGGRIPPIFYGKRPNKFGYVLLITGSLTLVAVFFFVRSNFTFAADPEKWTQMLIAALIGILQVIAAWRLLQAPRGSNKRR